jgi:hypothetical protein
VAGAVAGGVQDVDLESRQLEPLAAGERVVGVVALERTEPGRNPGHDVGEHRHLELRAVDRRLGRARHRGDGADVVEVGVGEQDRVDPDPELVDKLQDPLGLLAGIDDQPALRALAADDEAVLGHRADREHADVHR